MGELFNVMWPLFKSFWGYMSCAIWTVVAFWQMKYSPASGTQIRVFWICAGLSLVAGFVTTIWEQHAELSRFRSVPPSISLLIHDVVMHRTGDREWKWKNGEFLVQVSVELVNPAAQEVEYSAQLVFRGEAINLKAIEDVGQWEIVERKYYQALNSPLPANHSRSSFVTNPVALTKLLFRSVRNEGWLHFQVEGMGETDIAKRTLRVYATAKNGGVHEDRELAQDHIVRSDLVAMKKFSRQPAR